MRLAPPAPPRSPTTVRFASALLFGVAGLSLLSAVVELVFVNTDLSVYKDAYTGDTGSGLGSIVSATFDIFFVGGTALLAVLNGDGRKNARVTTYVLGGIFLVCGGLGNLSDPIHAPSGSAGEGTVARFMPAAYGISAGLLDALTVLAALGALVLLALPPSNRFFETVQRNRYVLVVAPQPHFGQDTPSGGHTAAVRHPRAARPATTHRQHPGERPLGPAGRQLTAEHPDRPMWRHDRCSGRDDRRCGRHEWLTGRRI